MNPAVTTRCGFDGIPALPYLCSMATGKPSPADDAAEVESEPPQQTSSAAADSPPIRN